MKRLSIGMRLTLSYFAIFLLAELIFGAGMWFILRENLYDIADATLEGQASNLERFLEARKELPAAQLEAELREDYKIDRSEDFVGIEDASGGTIYRSEFLIAYPLPVFTADQLSRPRYQARRLGRHPFRILSQKMEIGGRTFIVQIAGQLHEEAETLDRFRTYLLMFAPVLLLAASGVGYWLSRKALAPVDALARTARTISGHNLSSRLEQLHTGDEVQRLSDTLNEMLARIEAAFLRITEFTADASHELRTPIALIQTEAELALRKSRNEDEYREALQHILREAERTANLIEELLALARADSGTEALHLRTMDMLDVVRGCASKWKQVAVLRDIQFEETEAAPVLTVLGDADALRRVVDILLDNAFKYTPSPGKIVLAAEAKNGSAVVTVTDTGTGIAPADQSRIFERFYRVDKARSREQGGAGLGLAIARWIVQLHKGSITVDSAPGRGSTFCFEVPVSKTVTEEPSVESRSHVS